VTGSYEHGNGPWDCIKSWKFLTRSDE